MNTSPFFELRLAESARLFYARRVMLWIQRLGVALLLSLVSCGPRVYFYAEHGRLDRGVHVTVYEVYARGDRIYLEARVANQGGVTVGIDRGGWTLELPGGELLPRSVGVSTDHELYVLSPGETRDVQVDFKKEDHDLTTLTSAKLLVGGISFGDDPTPYSVGTITISKTPVRPIEAPPAPVATALPDESATPDASAAPGASATPDASAAPGASATTDATPAPDASAAPHGSASPAPPPPSPSSSASSVAPSASASARPAPSR